MLKHVPNILTIIRIFLIPFIVIAIFSGNFIVAFILFSISSLTDIIDGYMARKYDLVSNFGKLMDPLADKLTQISVLTSLVITGVIPLWILIVVIIKEGTMIVGASFLYGKDVVVYSRWYGKLSTVLLYIAITFSMFIKQFNLTGIWVNIDLLFYCIALTFTILALILYIRELFKSGVLNKQDLKKDVTNISIKKEKIIKK